MYESSNSHLFRTTTGIQTGPDTFDKSRLIMTFLINLGITRILTTIRLVQEGKAGWLEFLEKILAISFALSDTEDNTWDPLNGSGVADLLLLRKLFAIHKNSREPNF